MCFQLKPEVVRLSSHEFGTHVAEAIFRHTPRKIAAEVIREVMLKETTYPHPLDKQRRMYMTPLQYLYVTQKLGNDGNPCNSRNGGNRMYPCRKLSVHCFPSGLYTAMCISLMFLTTLCNLFWMRFANACLQVCSSTFPLTQMTNCYCDGHVGSIPVFPRHKSHRTLCDLPPNL